MTTQELVATCTSGIVFSDEAVRAIREGRKTQFRSACKKAIDTQAASVWPDGAGTGWIAWWPDPISAEQTKRLYPGAQGFKPRYQPGKRYYVKEAWVDYPVDGPAYRADGKTSNVEWRPARFMSAAYARYVFEIDSVKVERLQDITEEDAIAEGFEPFYFSESWSCMDWEGRSFEVLAEPDEEIKNALKACIHRPQERLYGAQEEFARAWDAINGKRAPWSSNPWIERYTLHLVQP